MNRTRTETVSVITAEYDNEVETHNVHLPGGIVKRYPATEDRKAAAADAVRWFAGLPADHEVIVHDDVIFENVRRYRVEFWQPRTRIRF